MYKIGDKIGKQTILGIITKKSPYKYLTRCECGYEGEKWYNSIDRCSVCKARSRKTIYKKNYINLELTCGKYTKIDKEDISILQDNCWYKSIRKSVESRINNKLVKIHRLIMNCPKGMVVDHINGDTLDNRKENLRICTNLDNHKNLNKVKGLSKYKGVHWSNYKNKYIGMITYNKKKQTKTFDNELDAAKWYDEQSKKFHGEFGKTNEDLKIY